MAELINVKRLTMAGANGRAYDRQHQGQRRGPHRHRWPQRRRERPLLHAISGRNRTHDMVAPGIRLAYLARNEIWIDSTIEEELKHGRRFELEEELLPSKHKWWTVLLRGRLGARDGALHRTAANPRLERRRQRGRHHQASSSASVSCAMDMASTSSAVNRATAPRRQLVGLSGIGVIFPTSRPTASTYTDRWPTTPPNSRRPTHRLRPPPRPGLQPHRGNRQPSVAVEGRRPVPRAKGSQREVAREAIANIEKIGHDGRR